MRKTKIICTVGPSTDEDSIMRNMMLAGMNLARFNFSHSSYEEHQKRFEQVKRIREELELPIATILDTKGPEVRIGKFENGKENLSSGGTFTLTTKDVIGTNAMVSVSLKELPQIVQTGSRILLDDGLIELRVASLTDTDVICTVLSGGPISNNKGVNIPGVNLPIPYVSKKDREDLIFGAATGFDYIAASFVRSAEDVMKIKEVLAKNNGKHVRVIAKIENAQGVDNIDEILQVADGIMVARGDMGVEIPLEEIPRLQKMLIHKCYNAGKQVITATQMLESMISHPRPTRAETTDVANAIYDGTSAIMLSGETAVGKYPVEAVKTMACIAERTELDIDYRTQFFLRNFNRSPNVTNAISHASCTTAYDLGATAIITVTKTGRTARKLSKYRPSIPIIGCTTDPCVYRQMALSWDVYPLMIEEQHDTDELCSHAIQKVTDAGYLKSGDLVVITAGVPVGIPGTTNLLRVHIVGDVLVSGTGIGTGKVCSELCVCQNEKEAVQQFKQHDILVLRESSAKLINVMKKAAAIVIEDPDPNSQAAIVGQALDIPVIVGADNATSILKSGTIVTVDAEKGLVQNSSKNYV